jgi:integrase/recombinase XerD
VTLSEAIDIYVRRKQAYGFLFTNGQKALNAFSRQVDDPSLNHVVARDILSFLDGPRTSTETWRSKYRLLKRFFEFWSLRGTMPVLLLPPPRPPSRQTFAPYIYTRREIRSLLTATGECQQRNLCAVDAVTLRCLLLTLYATGALRGEILDLLIEDVSFKNQRLTLHGNRVTQSRSIPINSDLQKELHNFVTLRHKGKNVRGPLFLAKDGQPLSAGTLGANFQRLRRIAGITRHDGAGYQPRMHDLRSTFAVHRITSWIKEGADLNRMLPALAAYMGNVSLATTEQYLSLTPERFRKELQKLSPQRRQRRWRDDPVLMKFLGRL